MESVKFDSIARFMPRGIPLNQQEKDEIASMFEIYRLKKNEHFIREYGTIRLIGGVTKGILYRYFHDQSGNLYVDHFICNDYFFTEYKCYKNHLPSRCGIKALTACEIIILSITNMEALIKVKPKYEQIVHEIIAGVLQGRMDLDQRFQHGNRLDRIKYFRAYYSQWLTSIPIKLIFNYLRMSKSEYYDVLKK